MCHVIDTVIQLYVTVGLGIRLKSMSVTSEVFEVNITLELAEVNVCD